MLQGGFEVLALRGGQSNVKPGARLRSPAIQGLLERRQGVRGDRSAGGHGQGLAIGGQGARIALG